MILFCFATMGCNASPKRSCRGSTTLGVVFDFMISFQQIPNPSEIAAMSPFEGIALNSVYVVTCERQAKLAVAELMNAGEVGFDTESKPTFHKGEKSEGPHVLQFATQDKAFIFLSHVQESHAAIKELLTAGGLLKIGFDLRGDLAQIQSRFQVRPEGMVDLGRSFKMLGCRNTMGASRAVALLFQQRMTKSKSVTTSNWSMPELTDRQLLYAANDAYVALKVYCELGRLRKEGLLR
jgi:ribonuclease D